MKTSISATVLFLSFHVCLGQNVGIGTTSPTGPLSFASTLGNKIVLWGDGNSNHYGMGVQSGLLQFYSDASAANIAFGYGRSAAFTERMRILNGDNYDGMLLNGRLIIRNGSNDAVGGGGGVWLYKADNSALLGFMGTQNNQNIGFYGGPAGWGFTYNAINSRVGIGNNNPNAPLAFGAVLGKKITLYPGTLGDAGFGIAGNRLQIFSDNPNADVAIGYDAAGVFNERFAVKPNGALALQGNTGQQGQVLTSKGVAVGAVWQSPLNTLYQNTVQLYQSAILNIVNAADLPGMSYSFSVAGNAKVLVNTDINIQTPACALCGFSRAAVDVYINDVYAGGSSRTLPNNGFDHVNGTVLITVGAGNHTIKLKGSVQAGPPVTFWGTNKYSNMIVQVISE